MRRNGEGVGGGVGGVSEDGGVGREGRGQEGVCKEKEEVQTCLVTNLRRRICLTLRAVDGVMQSLPGTRVRSIRVMCAMCGETCL